MDRTNVFRRSLLLRLLQASALSLPFAAMAAGGCGSPVGSGGGGLGGGTQFTKCFAWSGSSTSGTGGTGGGGDAGVADDGGVTEDAGVPACPAQGDAYGMLQLNACDQLASDGTFADGECCYKVVESSCLTGRPFVVEEVARAAAPSRAEASAWLASGGLSPRVDDLSPDARASLAAAWARDGLMEHASIASFGRFALELMAAGAPAELLALAHRAALDEIEHARLCLGLASAYAGETIAPAPFPFEGSVEVSADLASIAARAAREGCVGETLGSIQAAEQLAVAEDPAVRAALTIIVEDEARHAELAWRTVAWALSRGDERVRRAVEGAFAAPVALPDAEADPTLAAHGRLDRRALHAALSRALDDVVRPCARALLDRAALS